MTALSRLFLVISLLAACKPEEAEPEPTDTDPSACGDEHVEALVTITGKVTADDAPVAGAEVVIEERNYDPGVLGETVTAADGTFVLEARDVVWVEDCWGTLFDWYVVANEGGRTGEKGVNSRMHGAITDGSFAFDMTAAPVKIE